MGGAPPPPGPMTVKKYVAPPPDRPVPRKSAYPLSIVAEFSFEYWFNYFYDEVASPEAQRRFFLQISPAPGNYLRANQILDGTKKQLLADMMALGFLAYPANRRVSADEMFDTMRAKTTSAGHALQNLGVRVVFRGDGRPPTKIERDGGTVPQTRVATLATSRNFDKPWHPWNDATRANLVYFRKGPNQDNCLFSAISVTPNFEVATKFPLLNELRSTNPAALGSAMVEAERLGPAAGGLSKMASLKEKFEGTKLLSSRTNVYVVKIKGGWNTEAFQADSFPERAFENLKWAHHYALLKVIRVHYTDDMNEGHLIVVEDFAWLQPKPLLKQALGETPYKELKRYLETVVAAGKLAPNGTGGIAYAPPGVAAPLRIKKVMKFVW